MNDTKHTPWTEAEVIRHPQEVCRLLAVHDELAAAVRDMLADRDERGLSDYPSVARARAALAKVQPQKPTLATPWIAGPFGHAYRANALGGIMAAPMMADGTIDRENECFINADWEDADARDCVTEWWNAGATIEAAAVLDKP